MNRAVGIGALHRLDHQMQRSRRCSARSLRKRIAFQNVEHLDQKRAAGGRRRHRDDVIAAIAARAPALRSMRAIVLEIVDASYAAGGAHRGRDLFGDRASIEGARPVPRDRFERGGEIGLHEHVARRERRPSFRKILAEDGQRANNARAPRQRVGEVAVDREAVARKRDRGRNELRQRELAGAVFARAPAPAPRPCRARRWRGPESRDFVRVGFALASRKTSRVVAAGAVSR